MGSNSFGKLFQIMTWGESHGKAIGVVIDGCPAGLEFDERDINSALALRAPGKSPYTSPRKELDKAEILSGLFEGKTTGAPICIMIPNQDADSSKYEPLKELLRPGHANYTYLEKYGIYDYRGGGRSSGRETASRVAAGAVARKLLEKNGIQLIAYISQIGSIAATKTDLPILDLRTLTYQSLLYCPDANASSAMAELINKTIEEGDSVGGIVEFAAVGVPTGLGDPVYAKLEATLGAAMMSLPASKGFEIGSGFRSTSMRGSEHNDKYVNEEDIIRTDTNFAGGTLGGISNGMPIVGRVAFKPASSIKKKQETLTITGEKASIELPSGSRHDPCVAIRAVPVVEAMVALVLADALLLNRCARL